MVESQRSLLLQVHEHGALSRQWLLPATILTKKAMTPKERLRQSIDEKLKRLPVLPTAVMELLALDQNSEDYSDKLVALLELEPSMAARVLGVSNSARYAPEQPIRSIPQAVARIGARRACQVV